MTNIMKVIAAATILLGGTVQPLLAQDAPMSGAPETASFSDFDTNQDNVISADEAGASIELSEQWTELDTDQNGLIDMAEFSAFEVSESAQGETPAE